MAARIDVPDVLALVGAGAVTYGCWLVAEPLAWVAGGLLLLAFGLLAARRTSRAG